MSIKGLAVHSKGIKSDGGKERKNKKKKQKQIKIKREKRERDTEQSNRMCCVCKSKRGGRRNQVWELAPFLSISLSILFLIVMCV